MSGATEQENRLRRFASFFKGYVGVMPLVTAAVAPLLTMMKAIPVFETQKTTLATYSGLLGFLLLAWVFYVRGPLVRAMVPQRHSSKPIGLGYGFVFFINRTVELVLNRRFYTNILPLLLIVGRVFCYIKYFATLDKALADLHLTGFTRKEILERFSGPFAGSYALQAYYVGIFLFAQMAFVLMALREYAYGVLKIPEIEILGEHELPDRGPKRPV